MPYGRQVVKLPDGLTIDDICRFYTDGRTLDSLAAEFRIAPSTIRRWMARNAPGCMRPRRHPRFSGDTFRLHRRDRRKWRDLVDGLMLGDGYIHRDGYIGLEQAIVRTGWVMQVGRALRTLGLRFKISHRRPKQGMIKSTGQVVQGGPAVVLGSVCTRVGVAERQRWYPKSIKRVPRDLRLTPQVMAHWVSGDGAGDGGRLILCTQGFLLTDIKFLCARMRADLGVVARPKKANKSIVTRRQQYEIYIPRRAALRLKSICRQLMPKCTRYKFAHVVPAVPAHIARKRALRARWRGHIKT